MKLRQVILSAFAAMAVLFAAGSTIWSQPVPSAAPPTAPVRPVTDDYHGRKVIDPYRYMEDLKDAEVQAWFKGQNEYTRAVLASIPGRAELLARIKTLDEAAPASVSDLRRLPSGRLFYQKRLASEDVAKLYTRAGLDGKERLLVDPTKLAAPAGAHYSISYYGPSFDGRYVAYGIALSGSEDAVLHVVETQTGRETGDTRAATFAEKEQSLREKGRRAALLSQRR